MKYTCSAVIATMLVSAQASSETLLVPEEFPTIEDAIDEASDGDTIMISAGNYPAGNDGIYLIEDDAVSFIGETNADGTPAVILSGALGFNGQGTSTVVVQNMQMESLGLYDCTADVLNCWVVNGNDNVAGIVINQAQGTVRNCRIAEGYAGFLPSGVYMTDQIDGSDILTSDFDFFDCVIENNSGGCPFPSCGGTAGVRIEDGMLDLVRCVIRNNSASGSGGISMASLATVSLTDTTVCGNSTPGQIIGVWTDNGGNYVADECPADCSGDLNGDESVDGADLGTLLSLWGTDGSGAKGADINNDGIVNGADLGLFLSAWGPCDP